MDVLQEIMIHVAVNRIDIVVPFTFAGARAETKESPSFSDDAVHRTFTLDSGDEK